MDGIGGGRPGGGAAGGAGTLVVLNKSAATASLIDLDSNEVVATVPTGTAPHEVAVSPDGRLAVASNYGRRDPGSTLTVIDVPAARAVRTIDLGEYRRPHGIQWLPDGRHVVVTAEENRALLTVDVESGRVVSATETRQRLSHMVVVTPDGSRAFVANIGSGSVTVIDLRSGSRVDDIPTGDGAEGIAITPDGKEVWITNREADTVTVLDASSLEVVKELESKSFPIRAGVTPDGRHVLVSNARSGDVAVFDAAGKREVRRIVMKLSAGETEGRLFGESFGESSVPIGILIRPDGRRAYVAHANADVVSVVDLDSWKVVGELKPGREPDGLGYSPLRVEARGGGG
ncbi:MAG: cytochrome D1 domain-containing protein [Acidobacteriota bacterium]